MASLFTRKNAGFVAGTIAIFGFLSLLAFALLTNSPVTGNSGATRLGKPAPDFSLPTFDGVEFVLSESRGQPVVINFWASWCPPCIKEAPVLEAAWQVFSDRGVEFVGVDIQDTREEAVRFVESFGLTYPNVMDIDGEVTVNYGVIGLPVTFFLDSEGIVVRRWVGAIESPQISDWLEQLLAGEQVNEELEGTNTDAYYEFE